MTVPEAIERAKQHLVTVLPEYAGVHLQLEELETPPSPSKWSFTFSATFPLASNHASNLADVLRGRRISKSVQIDPESGALVAVKNASV
jgi:hypothetical protein